MEVEKEFTARFFSHDSIDKYSNVLSSWTTELEQPIDFGGHSYECGVSEIFLNPRMNNEFYRGPTRDGIFMLAQDSVMNLKTFVTYALHHSISSAIYTRGYFSEFLNECLFFEPYTIESLMDHGVWPEVNKTSKIRIKLDLKEYITSDDNLADYMAPHSQLSVEEFRYLFVESYAGEMISMKEILKWIVQGLIAHMRHVADLNETQSDGFARASFHNHSKKFFNVFSHYENKYDVLHKSRKKHLYKANKMIHKFIEHFVSLVEEQSAEMSEDFEFENVDLTIGQYPWLFLYFDGIMEQFVGEKKLKVIFTSPILKKAEEYVHIKVDNIQYAKVGSPRLKTVSFLFLDQHGKQMSFVPSFSSNHVALKFRRINN
jgi:hypothetical protein